MEALYNIIAELCSYIIHSCTEDFFVQYSCVASSEKTRVENLVRSKLPVLFRSDGGVTHTLADRECNGLFYTTLLTLIEELKEKSDFFGIMGVTQILDEALENELKQKTLEFQKEDFSVVLNTNREITQIGLLPRCSCWWERKRRLSHCYNRLDNFLFNFLLMENSILGELIDRHYYLPQTLFPNFISSRSLKIAASPLRLERNFDIHAFAEDKVQYFKIDYPEKNYSADNELIWNKILDSAKNECDIIVFPEMLGNPEVTAFVQAKIEGLKKDDAELAAKIPSMIILPSFWEKRRNTVTILDKNGNLLCRQAKQNPFRAESGGHGYLEGIVPSRVVNIFHYEGIGRIAILICKDFLTTRYMEQLMRCFKLTLIIVPSFSTGSYDFLRSFDLCAHDDCNVVWINTCAAMESNKKSNFEYVGYVRKRISRFDDEGQQLRKMPICPTAFDGKCGHDCIFYETIESV
ncbi:MAG: carbon-nitrogen hydrolase family protein [Treponema sp.]|nr:carbon-nitrogen hydrolase family protein [Treponema sp.]MBR0486097.1 carbon-nitrogen hydrolase family protein [Treponema sp.]